ncbi:hypothetical protein HKCCE4037_00770 [Rhodobacterales bacterium HKCCE4037]|nr:hypothetical protein [Rhodobacterales bacterium HKCCE4037]
MSERNTAPTTVVTHMREGPWLVMSLPPLLISAGLIYLGIISLRYADHLTIPMILLAVGTFFFLVGVTVLARHFQPAARITAAQIALPTLWRTRRYPISPDTRLAWAPAFTDETLARHQASARRTHYAQHDLAHLYWGEVGTDQPVAVLEAKRRAMIDLVPQIEAATGLPVPEVELNAHGFGTRPDLHPWRASTPPAT